MAECALVSQDIYHNKVCEVGSEAGVRVAHGPTLAIRMNQKQEEMSYDELEELKAAMDCLRQGEPPAQQSTSHSVSLTLMLFHRLQVIV